MAPDGEKQKFLFVDGLAISHGTSRSASEYKSTILSHAQARRREREKQVKGGEIQPTSPRARYDKVFFSQKSTARPVKTTETSFQYGRQPDKMVALSLAFPSDNGNDPFYCTATGRDGRMFSFVADGLIYMRA